MNKNIFILYGNRFKIYKFRYFIFKCFKNHENENAVIFNDNEIYSYKDLNLYSEKIVKIFNKNNLKKRDVIAIDSHKNIISFSVVVACWKTGECLTYSFFDSGDESSRIYKIIKILNPKKVIVFNKKRK